MIHIGIILLIIFLNELLLSFSLYKKPIWHSTLTISWTEINYSATFFSIIISIFFYFYYSLNYHSTLILSVLLFLSCQTLLTDFNIFKAHSMSLLLGIYLIIIINSYYYLQNPKTFLNLWIPILLLSILINFLFFLNHSDRICCILILVSLSNLLSIDNCIKYCFALLLGFCLIKILNRLKFLFFKYFLFLKDSLFFKYFLFLKDFIHNDNFPMVPLMIFSAISILL